jgi:hypothetical protein
MEGKRVIHITISFLYYIEEKVWEGSETIMKKLGCKYFDVDQLSCLLPVIKHRDCCFFMIFVAFPGFFLI